ncbi:hypothetical protein ABIC45_002967 [Mucilaginibacter rubeus]|uniref:hypothetical protein n=1 Tax=Mucilaginibacter rubeus TaxID=2027860 RepID=UPI0033945A0D
MPTNEIEAINRKFMAKNFPDLTADTEFYHHCELINCPDAEKLRSFQEQLLFHPHFHSLKDRFVFNEENLAMIHILRSVPLKDIGELSEEQRRYYPICSKEEIQRISDAKNNADNLLHVRAFQVAKDPTLQRVMFRAMDYMGDKWNFTKYFNSPLFRRYVHYLKPDKQAVCKDVVAGFYHVKESNGSCVPTPFGNFIAISLYLKKFMYYMNLWEYGHNWGVAQEDCQAAMWLGIRTMMGSEPPDFELDPRSKLPKSIHQNLMGLVDLQLLFIIGHEYAHHYLGHLDGKTGGMAEMLKMLSGNVVPEHFKPQHQQELDADYHALINTRLGEGDLDKLTNAAFDFLLFMDIYETVRAYNDSTPEYRLEHPKPITRLYKLRERLPAGMGRPMADLEEVIARNQDIRDVLITHILGPQYEILEADGSVYLPGYHNAKLIDRLDF